MYIDKHIPNILIGILFVSILISLALHLHDIDAQYFINISDYEEFSRINDGIIYFGRDSCPECAKFTPILKEIAIEQKIDIYYFNTDYFRQNSILSEDELQTIFNEYHVTNVPILIGIKHGGFNSLFSVTLNENVESMKETVRNYISFDRHIRAYIPHYTITIVMFIISILLSGGVACANRMFALSSDWVPVIAFAIANLIALFFLFGSSVAYIERNSLGGDVKYGSMLISSFIMNLLLLMHAIISFLHCHVSAQEIENANQEMEIIRSVLRDNREAK
jgi:predicted bacteriocin transport accessory protein